MPPAIRPQRHTGKYLGEKTREISFPLGGLGTGCIGLAGNGRLVDWEIANKPAKGTLNGNRPLYLPRNYTASNSAGAVR